MKLLSSIYLFVMLFFMLFSENENHIIDNVSSSYGLKNFETINTIEFTFNVKKVGIEISRHWIWKPKSNEVIFVTDGENIVFKHHNAKGDLQVSLDKKFVNDCYWLLFPYYLSWDKESYTYEVFKDKLSPINKIKSTKLVIEYISDDGFSPNDIYELFLNENHQIIEWIYRKGGAIIPTKITTWEQTKSFNKMKFSTIHNGQDENFKVWFDDIKID
ncbi:MAG: hypothetical protein QM499_02890 [Flavobacteriaceae bacterium]